IGAGDDLDEVAHAVAVGIAVQRIGLAGIDDAVAVLVLHAVEDAVVVGVAIEEVGAVIAVAVDRRIAARFDRIGYAVAVAVEIAEVRDAIVVEVGVGLDEIGDAVVVAVLVEIIGDAVAVAVAVRRAAFIGIGDAVAVGVGGRHVVATSRGRRTASDQHHEDKAPQLHAVKRTSFAARRRCRM